MAPDLALVLADVRPGRGRCALCAVVVDAGAVAVAAAVAVVVQTGSGAGAAAVVHEFDQGLFTSLGVASW